MSSLEDEARPSSLVLAALANDVQNHRSWCVEKDGEEELELMEKEAVHVDVLFREKKKVRLHSTRIAVEKLSSKDGPG